MFTFPTPGGFCEEVLNTTKAVLTDVDRCATSLTTQPTFDAWLAVTAKRADEEAGCCTARHRRVAGV